jgi:hypothetical protein
MSAYFFEQQLPCFSGMDSDWQQPASQFFAPALQQSHSQASHEQTPVAQQQPPSGQHEVQSQVAIDWVDATSVERFAFIAMVRTARTSPKSPTPLKTKSFFVIIQLLKILISIPSINVSH